MSLTLRRPAAPCWNRKGPCASPIPTRPASVVSLTTTSLTVVIVWVDVRTACGNGAERKYVSSVVTFTGVDDTTAPETFVSAAATATVLDLDARRPPGSGWH